MADMEKFMRVVPEAQGRVLNAKVNLRTPRPPATLQLNAKLQKPSASLRKRPLYPDLYRGPGPTTELVSIMDDLDINRDKGTQRAHNWRKRRHRGKDDGRSTIERERHRDASAHNSSEDDDGYDRRPQRRRYEQPIAARLRRELLVLGENPQTSGDDVVRIGNDIAANFEDDQVRGDLLDIAIQLVIEQPLKIPFVAAVILYANDKTQDVTKEILSRAAKQAQSATYAGDWRKFKLVLRFFACLQGILEGEGVFAVFDDLFNRAADLQVASEVDALGLELVKIILLTIPYVMASNATGLEDKVKEWLGKTEIIAQQEHKFQWHVDPLPLKGEGGEFQNILALLQEQLQEEQHHHWPLSCIPRLYDPPAMENGIDGGSAKAKLMLPSIKLPVPTNPGSRTPFPEAFFSLYTKSDLSSVSNVSDVQTVPNKTDIAGSLIRDALVDTINIIDFNRNAVAKFLVEMDCFWAPNTFAKRGTSIDKLKNFPEGMSTWKPEDMALDAIFSQIFYLPSPEHKLVYYHSVTTELCKLSPGTIAPCLGRAMRFMYRRIDDMDMDLSYRFMDWFAHHLSNFEFRWKWDEWQEYLSESDLHPKKAFVVGAIDKEIRLSFAKRIRETLPRSYHGLIPEEKEKDTPDFKYTEDHPYASEGREILQLLRKKATEDEVQAAIQRIQDKAKDRHDDPLLEATDAYVTTICYIGSKSLSHVLSYIERCKEHLESIVQQTEAARRQIVTSVVAYWSEMPGTAVNIVDKLLNYNIVTPTSVIEWALGAGGAVLAEHWRYEMVSATMGKVTNRVNQLALTLVQNPDMSDEIRVKLKATLEEDREKMFVLFHEIGEAVGPLASGHATALEGEELNDGEQRLVIDWAKRWQHVFESRRAVEMALVSAEAVAARVEIAKVEMKYRTEVEAEEKARWEAEKARREAEEKVKREAEENAIKIEDGQQNGDFAHDAEQNLDMAFDVA